MVCLHRDLLLPKGLPKAKRKSLVAAERRTNDECVRGLSRGSSTRHPLAGELDPQAGRGSMSGSGGGGFSGGGGEGLGGGNANAAAREPTAEATTKTPPPRKKREQNAKKRTRKNLRLTFRKKYRAADIERKKNSIVPGCLFEI